MSPTTAGLTARSTMALSAGSNPETRARISATQPALHPLITTGDKRGFCQSK